MTTEDDDEGKCPSRQNLEGSIWLFILWHEVQRHNYLWAVAPGLDGQQGARKELTEKLVTRWTVYRPLRVGEHLSTMYVFNREIHDGEGCEKPDIKRIYFANVRKPPPPGISLLPQHIHSQYDQSSIEEGVSS